MALQVPRHNSLLEELVRLLTVAAEECTALLQLLRLVVEPASRSTQMVQEMDYTGHVFPPTGAVVVAAVQAQPVLPQSQPVATVAMDAHQASLVSTPRMRVAAVAAVALLQEQTVPML
jgi:hypothetical protein